MVHVLLHDLQPPGESIEDSISLYIEETVNLRKEKVTEMFLKVTERP